jgi:hypothetical protein
VRNLFGRERASLGGGPAQLVAARPAGIVAIEAARWRAWVKVRGAVSSICVVPGALGAPVLECTIFDETGGITLVFLGRRAIGGVALGRRLEAEGRVIEVRRRLVLMNPLVELLP